MNEVSLFFLKVNVAQVSVMLCTISRFTSIPTNVAFTIGKQCRSRQNARYSPIASASSVCGHGLYRLNSILLKIVSEYDQEIPQSQTADKLVAS